MNFLKRILGEHSEKRVYLDHAAATPLRHQVKERMMAIYESSFANPSSIYREGVVARVLITEAREHIAKILQIRPDGVVFTSGGTEGNNLAILGLVEQRASEGVVYSDMEVITTALEHTSVTETCKALEQKGVIVHRAPVNEYGVIVLAEFEKLVSEKTVMLVTAYINSEIGVIQPLRKLRKLLRVKAPEALVVVDGAQAPLWEPCQLDQVGADILTLDGGKMYGPKGIGALAMRHGVALGKTVFGGGQERGLRPGTENAPLIAGFELALAIAQENHARRSEGIQQLRDYSLGELQKISGVMVNGGLEHRVANNINISLPGIDTEFLTIWLDEKGVAVSTKSACSDAGGGESVVVKTISGDATRAVSTLRITLGEGSQKSDIDTLISLLKEYQAKQK